jgi:hypothetical protein
MIQCTIYSYFLLFFIKNICFLSVGAPNPIGAQNMFLLATVQRGLSKWLHLRLGDGRWRALGASSIRHGPHYDHFSFVEYVGELCIIVLR